MKSIQKLLIALLSLLTISTLHAKGHFTLSSQDISNSGTIPAKFAVCQRDYDGSITAAQDISPSLTWQNPPAGTESYALIITDEDVPLPAFVKSHPNSKLIASVPRITGYQWVLVNIPSSITTLPEGAGSTGFVHGGKPPGQTPYGLTGVNVYAGANMQIVHQNITNNENIYGGYDGPCPSPFDDKSHHYIFRVFALNTPSLEVPENGYFTGNMALHAMQGHILGIASMNAYYSTYGDDW